MQYNVRNGFTLIELSIVLVIIGLIVGVVLMGRDLIRASEIRATIKQVEDYKTAAQTFKLKYNCIPGDCATATSLLDGVTDGNGDGNVYDAPGVPYNDAENLYFWQHLVAAGLIGGNYTSTPGARYLPDVNFPAAKWGGGITIGYYGNYDAGGAVGTGQLFPATYGNMFLAGDPWGDASSNNTLRPSLSGTDAFAIDTKFDDGLPASGKIITWRSDSNYSGGCSSTTDPTTAIYNNVSDITCGLMFLRAVY